MQTKILIMILVVVLSIGAAVVVWQQQHSEERAAHERATQPHNYNPDAQKPITADDLFKVGNG